MTATGNDALWHPFASMNDVRSGRTVMTHAEDVWVYDDQGRRYLDATASLWYSNVGHGRSEIANAVAEQLCRLDAFHIFNDYANEPALALAGKLAARAPVDDGRVFFTSGGGDSIDTAAKLARAYHAARGESERTVLLHREHSYHGTHGFGTALAGIPANKVAAPLVPDVVEVPYDDEDAVEKSILNIGPERIAAYFAEPVIGAGGVRLPPAGHLARVAEICRRHGVLFVADSVICGFGRLGTWFGIERFDVRPDMVVFAKGVTSGYQPLGGVVVSGRVAGPFWDEPGRIFSHGQTYAGHPAACAAGLANLEIMEREGLLARSREMEVELAARLEGLVDHPLVDHARSGVGFLGALQLSPAALTDTPKLPAQVFRAARERGVLVRATPGAIAVSPPLTATAEHLDVLADGVRHALDDVHRATR